MRLVGTGMTQARGGKSLIELDPRLTGVMMTVWRATMVFVSFRVVVFDGGRGHV